MIQGLRLFGIVWKNTGKLKINFILFDKVIGLAAARLVVYSGIIAAIHTRLISQPAKQLLKENSIKIEADEIVANILRKDKSAVCPGEIIALNTDGDLCTTKFILPGFCQFLWQLMSGKNTIIY
jgi:hypothetical protein